MAMDKLMLLNEVARSILEAEDDDSGPSQPRKPNVVVEDPDPGPFFVEDRDRDLSPRPFVPVTQCCYLLCHDKVPKDDQRKLWDLWENTMGMDKAAQDEYLSSLIEFRPPATVKVEPKRKREYLWRYTINPNGTEIQCCQKFLLKLYQISEKRLRVIQEKTRNGDSFVEKRGKHSRPKPKAQNLWDLAEEHLATLPFTQGLDGTEKRYLKDSSLTIKKLWAMFEEWYEATTGQELVGLSYKTYHKKFQASKKYAFLYQLVIPDEISGNTWLDEPTKQLMKEEKPPKGKKRKGKPKK